jgi:DNA-directed RNA polymerase specialized sigma24 family protein
LNDTWTSLEPLLEQAMDCLGEKDRLAILLRYYQKQSMREISLVLGNSEDAAKMRVNRAVEKLRAFFKKRGAAHTTATSETESSTSHGNCRTTR